MRITNIKLHVTLKPTSCLKQYQSALQCSQLQIRKRTNSFVTLKSNSFTYTCFYSGFVNITGIKKRKNKKQSVKILERLLNLERKSFTKPIVDNISSTWGKHKTLKQVNLLVILNIALKHCDVKTAKYNRETFPALFLKTYNWGTILWYGSPAIVAVGSKSKKEVKQLDSVIKSILNHVSLL